MKTGVVIFHANLSQYNPEWIRMCLQSIMEQTYQDYTVYEINYSDSKQVWKGSQFYSIPMKNNGWAQNFIIDRAFEDGCDFVFVTNIDDYYHPERFERQLQFKDYDIISSDFVYVQNGQITRQMIMSGKDVRKSFERGVNIIANPVVCLSRNLWSVHKYNPDLVPEEDFDLWKRALNDGYKFKIIPEILLYYRIHQNQISRK